MGAGPRLALVATLAACVRAQPPPRPTLAPRAVADAAETAPPAPSAEPVAASTEPVPARGSPRPPEVEALRVTYDALRAVATAPEDVIVGPMPPPAVPLFARMRRELRAWVVRAVEGTWREAVARELPARLTGPLAEAGLLGGERPCDGCVEGASDFGAIERLEVIAPDSYDDPHPCWIVIAGLSVGASTDESVYVFDEDGGGHPRLALAWERPGVERPADGRADVRVRLVPRGDGFVVLAQATHRRGWSRWQWMSWTLLAPGRDGGDAREVPVYHDSIDIQGACGPVGVRGYGPGPWLDPDGLTVMGCSYHRARDGEWGFCERTARFRWSGERLVRVSLRESC